MYSGYLHFQSSREIKLCKFNFQEDKILEYIIILVLEKLKY